jgi:3-isopropylmalate/(R)-2-methylmalate dehydratase small subunit
MDAFTTHTGTAAPLRRTNVDTDQIIPAEYLKRITRTGFEDGLFVAWRTNEPDFVLNKPEYAGASILVAGPDFGTGSSREHACWALLDGGFRVVISSRFADIFRNNSTKSGLLTVQLPQADVEALWTAIEADPAAQVTVDLQADEIRYGDTVVPFRIDEYTRWRLLEGLDDVGLTERHLEDVERFEAARPSFLPKTQDPLPPTTRTLVAGP